MENPLDILNQILKGTGVQEQNAPYIGSPMPNAMAQNTGAVSEFTGQLLAQGQGINPAGALGGVPSTNNTGFFGNAFGGQNAWAPQAASSIAGLVSALAGWEAMQTGKDNLAFQKDAFNKQFGVQKNLTNSQLADRQAARLGANPGGYESVGSYMDKYGVK